jgi:hypothetical protein
METEIILNAMGKHTRIEARDRGLGFSAFFLVSLIVLPVCGCEKPECSGEGTMDLGADQGTCDRAWINGEQMCPQETMCGHVVSCMAMSDWSYGSCTCKPPSRQTCCPIAIVDPEEGALRSMSDDVDLDTQGLQIRITVDIDCWYITWAQLFVHPCDQAPGEDKRWLESQPDFHVPAVLNIGDRSGCFEICAETMVYGIVLASDSIQVCVE